VKRTAHATGMTLIWVVVLAIALSLLPLPEALRPFPSLREDPGATLLAMVRPEPRRSADSAGPAMAAGPGLPPGLGEASLPVADEALVARHGLTDALAGLRGTPLEQRALELEALGTRMGTRHVEIEPGCRATEPGGGCQEEALAPFFKRLSALRRGEETAMVRGLHLGDSLIASDHITDVIRDRLQVRHGNGGPGWLFVDRPTRGAGRTVRTGIASDGWTIEKITDRTWPKGVTGLSGVIFSASGVETSTFKTGGASSAEVWFRTRPGGGALELTADGKSVGRVITDFPDDAPAYARIALPEGSSALQLKTSGKPVQVYGVSLEQDRPGVVYDSIGLPGSTAKVLMRPDPATFQHQLAQRDPALIVLMLGGNEAFELSRKRTTLDEARESLTTLVKHLRTLQPQAACLMAGTLDAGVKTMGGDVVPRAGSREISDVIREVARAEGCAYWDALEAMGGVGVTKAWLDARLMHEDLVHPRSTGADLLGHLFDVALERAHLRWQGPAAAPKPTVAQVPDPPGLEGAEHLAPLRDKLAALEAGKRQRVAVAQLGASHTAAHFFTDVMRARLAAQYGSRGRGYVAAGRASKRFPAGEVQRELTGTWKVLDAIQDANPSDPSGLARVWGANGIRAVLDGGASSKWRYCAGCDGKGLTSRVSLHYLETPDMGRLEVLLDGKPVALPKPVTEGTSHDSRVATWDAPGAEHTLEVRNLGPGSVTLFGASSEQQRPGIVYDALGLPTATVFDLASFDRPTFVKQLEALAPDLVVLFYGTNESALSDFDPAAHRQAYAEVFDRLRAARADVACVFVGPTDRMSEGPDGAWVPAVASDAVMASLRQIAREQRCAFWSARAEMGGPGGIARWLAATPRLAHPDHIHLSPAGYERLAGSFADALLSALAGDG